MNDTFGKERNDILVHAKTAISRILLSEDRTSKHAPYTWMNEDINQHLLKAVRHINTYMQIKHGYHKNDGENHLDNAICRLSMAVAKLEKIKLDTIRNSCHD